MCLVFYDRVVEEGDCASVRDQRRIAGVKDSTSIACTLLRSSFVLQKRIARNLQQMRGVEVHGTSADSCVARELVVFDVRDGLESLVEQILNEDGPSIARSGGKVHEL